MVRFMLVCVYIGCSYILLSQIKINLIKRLISLHVLPTFFIAARSAKVEILIILILMVAVILWKIMLTLRDRRSS